jgi:hypothetical protein
MGLIKQYWLEQIRQTVADHEDWYRSIDEIVWADGLRRARHQHKSIHMTNDEYEFRYERRGDVYLIKRWYDGTEWTDRGNTDNVPVWLVPILVVAKISGHLRKTNEPPPDEILWFRTDKNHHLTTFIDLEDPRK